MCLLTEAIKVLDGKLFNTDLHAERMNKARKDLFGLSEKFDPVKFLVVPEFAAKGLYKCRITYGREINSIEWSEYKPRKIITLKLVRCDSIDYSYKYNDRTVFDKLLEENNCGASDAVIIVKNNRVTDSFFSNIVLSDGDIWYTPKFPLLTGTKRAELLRDGIIFEKDISENEFYNYEKVKLINAMLDFETAPTFLTKDVKPAI